jgi:hypothetical protein
VAGFRPLPRRILPAATVVLVLAGSALALLLVFGSRNDDANRSSNNGDTAKLWLEAKPALTAPGVTAEDITLGMSAPFSGPAKELGHSMQVGIDTYLRQVNESAGGIHGRKLKLLSLDDGYELAVHVSWSSGPSPSLNPSRSSSSGSSRSAHSCSMRAWMGRHDQILAWKYFPASEVWFRP